MNPKKLVTCGEFHYLITNDRKKIVKYADRQNYTLENNSIDVNIIPTERIIVGERIEFKQVGNKIRKPKKSNSQAEREKVEKIWGNTVARGDLLRVNHGRIANVPIFYYDGIIMELSNKKRKFRIKELIRKKYNNLYGEDMCGETVLVDRIYDMIEREIFEVVYELPNSQYSYDMIIKRGKNFEKA